jgi:hypothetical protein
MERRVFDDKLATRDVTFLYLALKPATENATDKAKFPRRKVDDRGTNFITLSKEEKETYLFMPGACSVNNKAGVQ